MGNDIIATGSGTREDPDSYVVNEALLDAIERGRWNTTMLSALVRFARTALRRDVRMEAVRLQVVRPGGVVSDLTALAKRRSDAEARIMKALEHLPREQQMHIVMSFITLHDLERIADFQGEYAGAPPQRPDEDCVIRRDGGPKCGCVVKDGVVTDWCRREVK